MTSALASVFGLESQEGLQEADILRLVQAEILRLFERDREKLLAIAYRLDVDEEKFRACFLEGKSPEGIASLLAQLFFDREKAKISFRSTRL